MFHRLCPQLIDFKRPGGWGRGIATLVIFTALAAAQQPPNPQQLERNIRGEMDFLASDALNGRGSATPDELVAATYVASRFEQLGLEPVTKGGSFIQPIGVTEGKLTAPPELTLTPATGQPLHFTHGKEIAVLRAGSTKVSASLTFVTPGAAAPAGSAAFIHLTEDKTAVPVFRQIYAPCQQGAKLVIVAWAEQMARRFKADSAKLPEVAATVEGLPDSPATGCSIILLNDAATKAVSALPAGTTITFSVTGETQQAHTYNVIGVLRGSTDEAITISAHIDHLGRDPKLAGDQIYNGADDDASGVAAVLEMARAFTAGPRPRRTIYFIGFGSEEKGGFGSQYFLAHPPLPIEKIVADINFEMIGRPDPKVATDQLWLTGWERSDLGPTLAQHGAKLVADPHPTQDFFERSDNFSLAKKGVIAQTVSSFGLHTDYHQPSDELSKIDFTHMTQAIGSMIAPLEWLANSDFTPHWLPGKKP